MTGRVTESVRVLIAVLTLLLLPSGVAGQRVTGQSASEAFSKGDFKTAYEHYSMLLESFPRDPIYLYGAGVSLVVLSMKPSEAIVHLERAISLRSAIRSVPGDVTFYLGRALHFEGRYGEAIEAYERFSEDAGRREARSRGVAELIKQCVVGTGALAIEKIEEPEPEVTVTIDEPLREKAVTVRPPEPLTARTDSLLTAALQYRHRSDSLTLEIVYLEEKIKSVSDAERVELLRRIGQLKEIVRTEELSGDSLMTAAGLTLPKPVIVNTIVPELPLTISTDTVKTVHLTDSATRQVDQAEPLTSLFRLQEKSFYSAANPIPISDAFPNGMFYSIQLAVFRNPVDPAHFKRLYPLFGIKNQANNLTYYYTGLFRRKTDADKALLSTKNEGFSDAFVVVFMDGWQVSAERGSILEREWGSRGFPVWEGVVPETAAKPKDVDTVPPTLLFRVEVMRMEKPATEKQVEEMKRVSSDMGLEIMKPTTGVFVYIVGKFLTFDSASSYADLLKRNGYNGARVAAYLGSREIPVETALKLFDRQKQ